MTRRNGQTTSSKGDGAGGGELVAAQNRRAFHDYAFEERYEAGIALVGTEVKSIRAGRANLTDAFCRFDGGELFVHNLHISPYEQGNRANVEPRRPRKLLLHRRELARLSGRMQEKGLALIPLRLLFRRGYAKLELGLGRGKRQYDKREAIARRDSDREARRALAEQVSGRRRDRE